MDHAAAHERIADLALESGALDVLGTSADPTDRALLDHIRGCDECRADAAASRALSDGLRRALLDLPGSSGLQPIAAPDALRAAVLEAARRDPLRGGTVPGEASSEPPGSRGRRWDAWLRPRWAAGLAAALMIALVGGLAGSQLARLTPGDGSESVVVVVATLNRVLAADHYRIVPLRTAAGASAGSVAWSRQDFAVLASTLAKPPSGQTYRCWLQWSGKSAAIGVMEFAGTTAYWTGSVGDWAAVAFGPGARFVVTLEPTTSPGPGAVPTSPILLQADLGT
jgi:anti-sigma-K factor RskA